MKSRAQYWFSLLMWMLIVAGTSVALSGDGVAATWIGVSVVAFLGFLAGARAAPRFPSEDVRRIISEAASVHYTVSDEETMRLAMIHYMPLSDREIRQ
jgi:hypothetical protein